MPPSKWDDEEEDSTPPSSPPVIARRGGKFSDEEDEDSDVAESWDKEEDSEAEREKAKQAAEAKAKAEAAAKASHKSKSQRIEERRMENMKRRQEEEEESSEEEEDDAEKRARLRASEKDADLRHAEDLFGAMGVNKTRSAKPVTTFTDPSDPSKTVELSSLKVFNPQTLSQFHELREVLVPLITANSKKAQYPSFATELCKSLARDMQSDHIKKIASAMTALSNEKLKEEKAAEKTGKRSKAAKSKTTLNAARETTLKADTTAYDDDGLDDGDFM